MLYSKCDIDFSAMGAKKPVAEEAIEFKGTLESAVHEVRMKDMMDQFFIVHEQCDFEEMALNAYVDAHGNEAILESSLTVIREAADAEGDKKIGQKIKEKLAEIPGMVQKALSTIAEKCSGASLEKLKEKIKGIKNVKVSMPDFKAWGDKILNALKSFSVFQKIIEKVKRGEKVTSEEVKEEVAKATGGDAKGNGKQLMNIEQPEEKSQTVDGDSFINTIKEYASKFGTAIKDAGGMVKRGLQTLLGLIGAVAGAVIFTVLSILCTAFLICILAISLFIRAFLKVVKAVLFVGKKVAGAVSDKIHGATKKDEGNFSGETVEA